MRISQFAQLLAVGGILIATPFSRAFSADEKAGAAEGAPAFVGAAKCKICHKKEEDGNQYGIWLDSRHAKAYETLASEKALAEAKKQGIENPQTAPECLKCHVTAFPVRADIANQKITLEEGVSCESCHGAGGNYYSKKTMQAVTDGEITPESVGLILPVTKETCLQCHIPEGNAFYVEFDFDEFVAKIAHPRPEPEG
jgi:hypothetical protein